MKKEMKKQRCQYSKEGIERFGKQRRGYVIGESNVGHNWRVIWDNLKSINIYAKGFIELNPLIDLYIDDDGIEKEKPIAKFRTKTPSNMTIEEQIQTDLDNGKYGMICSNEDTFKKYVFPLIEKAKQEEREKIKIYFLKQEEIWAGGLTYMCDKEIKDQWKTSKGHLNIILDDIRIFLDNLK